MGRPRKIIRLNYWNNDPKLAAAFSVIGFPAEARMSAGPDKFIAVREKGVTVAPGIGNDFNIQGLSHNLKYAGMISDLPFPLSIIPVTIATPLPKQIIIPPFLELMSTIRDISQLSSALVALTGASLG